MKYLVLGSSGQIGFELCKFLRNKRHEVIEFDIASNQFEDLRIRHNLEFLIKNDEGNLILPIREELYINMKPAITATPSIFVST